VTGSYQQGERMRLGERPAVQAGEHAGGVPVGRTLVRELPQRRAGPGGLEEQGAALGIVGEEAHGTVARPVRRRGRLVRALGVRRVDLEDDRVPSARVAGATKAPVVLANGRPRTSPQRAATCSAPDRALVSRRSRSPSVTPTC